MNIFTTLYPDQLDKIAELQDCLAYNYNKLFKNTEALKYAQSAVDLILKAYPDGNLVAIYSLNNLGNSLIKLNKIKQGLDALHQALNMSKKFSMDKNVSTAWILYDLGCAYFKAKNYKNALKYAEKALILRKELYGNTTNHLKLAESLYNLGEINLALGNKNKGLNLYKKSLKMYTALLLEHLPEAAEIKQKINKLK